MRCDAVIVGGGVAGCALAARLAAAGVAVTVLEREPVYRDQVRGEALVPWGFLEAIDLGIADAVTGAAGASVITRMVPYDESLDIARARRGAIDLSAVVPQAPGVIGVGHPELREALATAATKAGATVVRGVARCVVGHGASPSVDYERAGTEHHLDCRIVVGADGKNSATRTAAQIPFTITSPRVMLSGMLVDDHGAWDRAETTIAVSGRNQYIVIPRADGRIRLYVGRRTTDPERITGPDRISRFLDAYRTPALPCGEALATAQPLGPCATFPLTDAWTDTPVVPGVALIGDAAGWSNPIGAQGLGIALRDARLLAEALLDNRTWTPASLRGYSEERSARMARLRFATALTDMLSAFGLPDRTAKRARMLKLVAERPETNAALGGIHSGPWTPPAAAFSPDILTTLALT